MYARQVQFDFGRGERWALVFFCWNGSASVALQKMNRFGPTGKDHAKLDASAQPTAEAAAEFARRCCGLMGIDDAHAWEVEVAVKLFVGDFEPEPKLERDDGTAISMTAPE